MGPSGDEIDSRTRETREQIDEQPAESNAARYGTIAAVVVGAVVIATASVLIYRRYKRPGRREQLRRMLVEAFVDLPDMLRELPDELARKIREPLPPIKVVVNPETGARVRGALESMIRRVRD